MKPKPNRTHFPFTESIHIFKYLESQSFIYIKRKEVIHSKGNNTTREVLCLYRLTRKPKYLKHSKNWQLKVLTIDSFIVKRFSSNRHQAIEHLFYGNIDNLSDFLFDKKDIKTYKEKAKLEEVQTNLAYKVRERERNRKKQWKAPIPKTKQTNTNHEIQTKRSKPI